MRLNFNVLWVDDQPEHVAAQIESIRLKMADEGFEFVPYQCKTIDEMEKLISEDVFTDEVDLILVDWDLGNNKHGEDAIECIRQIIQYKDVVFYSGQATVVDLQEKTYNKKLEGVYCASRENLVDEIIGVFESLIKKVLDLDHTRGIVMGATCDIDHIVNRCLTLAHDKLDDEKKNSFISEAKNRVNQQLQNIQKQGNNLKTNMSVETLIESHMLFTSDHRLRLLQSILEEDFEQCNGAEIIASYRKDVIPKRNKLGHMVLNPQGKPKAVFDSTNKDNEVNIVQMRELRKLILNLRAEFRILLDKMQG